MYLNPGKSSSTTTHCFIFSHFSSSIDVLKITPNGPPNFEALTFPPASAVKKGGTKLPQTPTNTIQKPTNH